LFSHLRDIANQSSARTWLQAMVSVTGSGLSKSPAVSQFTVVMSKGSYRSPLGGRASENLLNWA